jgi:protein TonB
MTITLRSFMPYGAPDLQEAAPRHMVRALAAGSVMATTAFALAWGLSLMLAHPGSGEKRIEVPRFDVAPRYDVLRPPPPLTRPPVVKPMVPSKAAVDAVPVPAKDTPDNVDRTIKSQGEVTDEPRGGQTGVVAQPGEVETPPPFGTYVYTEVLPEPVTEIQPAYPAFAQSAGVQGLVLVHVLVGKDGRVMDARLDAKKHEPLLDAAALEAARKWVFTPALSNGHAVMVWATIPFRFKLH